MSRIGKVVEVVAQEHNQHYEILQMQREFGANPPGWQGRGGGRYRSQVSNASSTAHHGDSGFLAKVGLVVEVVVIDRKSLMQLQRPYGDAGASRDGWAGRGGGKNRPQLAIQGSTAHYGDAGASRDGWSGRGGGRNRPQLAIQGSTAHYGDAVLLEMVGLVEVVVEIVRK